ncbi:MAG: SusC/RagA family TonB-linked outer membrane protein, partial [Bacteroidales bacterium]|nr:SusC/RagA family TonB-linked outer membrane protein [Bacteroidales bacterium]
LAMLDENLLKRKKLTGNVYAELTPVKHLVWRSEVGFDVSNSEATTYKPMVNLGGWQRGNNSMSAQRNASTYWSVKNYLTYTNTFGKHNISAMVGQEAWESRWNYLGASNTGLPSDEIHNIRLATGNPTVNSGFGSAAMASFFTRETYNYDNRYLFTYTFRYDGSSNFGPDNRWAGFHSFAGSWRFTNEAFLQDFSNAIRLNSGKLRVGWGQTGNANIGSGAWESGMSKMPTGLGDSQRPANIANTGIHWEKQQQTNIGLDLSFLESRINLTVDLYRKISSDMLMSMALPSYMGTQGNGSSALAAPKGNYGTIENKGLEITLDTHPVETRSFAWSSNFQISFNRNRLLALDGSANAQLVGYGQWSDIVSVTEIGESLYNFYGYKVEGVYKDFDDIKNSPKAEKYPADGVFNRATTVWPGDLKFKDVNGDGLINENDRTNIGSPLPKFTFGWTNSFRFKNFDLSVFINGSYGNKILNYNLMGQGWNGLVHMNSTWTNQHVMVADRARLEVIDPYKTYTDGTAWYEDVTNVRVSNAGTMMPRPSIQDPNDNDRLSERYIEDGSYIRLKNISLGYTLPKNVLSRIKVDNIRLYLNVQNVYTLTRYKGFDPEVGASTQDSSGLTFGVDNGRYPSPMTCSFGLNITL